MRDKDFVAQLLAKVSSKDAPVALICARGVRSRGLSRRLIQAGFTNIIDVPEGMLGSGAGPGWLGAGLPVTRP
jgi:rhodanese-related sulfurtransferase